MRTMTGIAALLGCWMACAMAQAENPVTTRDLAADATCWSVELPGTMSGGNGTLLVKDRPAVFKGSVPDSFRLTFKARCHDEGKLGQIWVSFRHQGEFTRYALALRHGLLNDLFLLRYREKDFPDSTVDIANCYPLGFEPDTENWIPFRIEIRGSRILAWAGDAKYPQVDYTDVTPLTGGSIALGGSWHNCEFADVRLEKLDADEPLDLYAPHALKIRFGKQSDPSLRDWKLSGGEAFDPARGFGWDRDLRSFVSQNNKVPSLLHDGFVSIVNKEADALFSVAVPDGDYYVTAMAGTPTGHSYFHATVQDRPLMDLRLKPMQYATENARVHVQGGLLKLKLFSVKDEQAGLGNPINFLVIEPWAEAALRVGDKEVQRQQERAAYQPQTVSFSAEPSRLALDGRWLFMPAQDLPSGAEPQSPQLKDSDWHVVTVPSFWNPNGWWIYTGGRRVGESYQHRDYARVAAQTFDCRLTRQAWYRQWLRFGQQEKGRRYTIRFDAVASVAQVYFNGKLVGEHLGMFSPFEMDITDRIHWGSENLLAVKVVGEPQKQPADSDNVLAQMITMIVTSEHIGWLPRGIIYSTIEDLRGRVMNVRPGGIWQPVTLMASGEARIDNFFFKPRVDGASIEVELRNRRNKEVKTTLAAHVAGTQTEQAVTIPVNGQTKVTLEVKPGDLKLWSPEHPNLYSLTLSLSEGSTLLDQREATVGFRTTETRGDKFYLNGRPYWLGGANGPVHGLLPLDAKLADRFMSEMAKMHVRCTRTHSTPMTHTWLDASDRHGVGVSLEGPWSWVLSADTDIPDPKLWEAWRQEMLGLVRDLRNHPSIMLWTVSNENHIDWDPDADRRLKKWRMWSELIRAIKAVDPTRPVCATSGYERTDNRYKDPKYSGKSKNSYFTDFIQGNKIYDGDFTDEHRYIGHYSPSIFNYLYSEHSRNIGMGLPVMSQESATGYPNGDTGHLERKYIKEYVPQAWVGRDAYDHRNPQPYLDQVALMAKEWMEKVRRDRDTAGWQMFNCANWFRYPYDAEAIEAYPAVEAAKLALQPVLISLEMRDRHALAGSTLKGTLHVINDHVEGQDLKDLHCEVELCDAQDKVLSRKELVLPDCAYFKSSTAAMELTLPENLPYGSYVLTLQLHNRAQVLSENRYTLKLGSRQWTDAPAQGLNVGAVNLPKDLTTVLQQMGLRLETDQPWKCPVVLWGGKSVPEADSKEGRKLLKYAQDGGKLLLLETKQANNLLPGVILPEEAGNDEHGDRKNRAPGECVDMLCQTHPAFAGLGYHDLSWWNGQGSRPEVTTVVYRLDPENPAVTCLTQFIEPHISGARWARAFRSTLFTVKSGAGQVIVCEMRVSSAASDPIARRFLANLLAWTTQKN